MSEATTADVIRTALAKGYRWVYVGGEWPVLSNEPSTPRHPPGLATGQTDPLWTPIGFGSCAWCQRLLCLTSRKLSHARTSRNVFCDVDHGERFHQARRRQRRALRGQEGTPC